MADEEKLIVANRAAFHEYHILDKFEAGIMLTGTEVKSLRAGQIQLKESYVAVRDDEVWLFNAHISPYKHGNRENHDPTRTRKLLLHRREIERLSNESTLKGMTPSSPASTSRGAGEIEIGVARGKNCTIRERPRCAARGSRNPRQMKERSKDIEGEKGKPWI